MKKLLVALALAAFLPTSSAAAQTTTPSDPVAWTSYGYDNQLGNAVPSQKLTLRSIPRLGLAWSAQLEGAMYASPLAARVDGEALVFAATEAGEVYAVAASTGEIRWQRSLGTVETLECGTWGITATGAIDLERSLLFEISADGLLHALDLATGDEAPGYPLSLVENNHYEYVWGGLRIANDRLYVVVASYCDAGPPGGPMPEGRMLAVRLEDPGAVGSWDPVPGPGNMGGMWGWGGVSIDPTDGRVFTGVGNSYAWSDECQCFVDNAGYGNKLVALTPDLETVLDFNDPGIPPTGDSDFGAAPLLFQPEVCPPLAAANNKDGALYIWNRNQLSAGPLVSIPLGDGMAAFVGSPGWSPSKQMIYAAQSVIIQDGQRLGNGVTAWHAEGNCGFRPIWQRMLGDGNQATPLVVGDALFATGGKPGGFFALAAANGLALWSYPTKGRTVAAMISVGGAVFGADTAGVLYAFEPASTGRGLGSGRCLPV